MICFKFFIEYFNYRKHHVGSNTCDVHKKLPILRTISVLSIRKSEQNIYYLKTMESVNIWQISGPSMWLPMWSPSV